MRSREAGWGTRGSQKASRGPIPDPRTTNSFLERGNARLKKEGLRRPIFEFRYSGEGAASEKENKQS